MTAHLLILYPKPDDAEAFDRAYREEHLPYAGPRLEGATGVATKRVVGPAGQPQLYHLISDVSFPSLEAMKACADQLGRKPHLHRRRRRMKARESGAGHIPRGGDIREYRS
jgi:uncharacterized protein (TIGR02118 family)